MTKRTKLTTATERHEFMSLSATKTHHAVREAEVRQVRAQLDEWMRRWRTDPESILAEHRWTCECGRTVEPFVLEGLHDRPIVGAARCACGREYETERDGNGNGQSGI